MEPGTAYASLDLEGEDRFQRLRKELGLTTFGLNLLRLRPGQGSRIHRHERQEEAYLVLDGHAHAGDRRRGRARARQG